LPPMRDFFSLPSHSRHESILGITTNLAVVHILVSDQSTLTLHSHTVLPLSSPPMLIIPVDPMGWAEQAVLLSVSELGELAFWATEVDSGSTWKCTGKVRTGRTGLRLAACSPTKKSALGLASLIIRTNVL
jgi:hypothetical protein